MMSNENKLVPIKNFKSYIKFLMTVRTPHGGAGSQVSELAALDSLASDIFTYFRNSYSSDYLILQEPTEQIEAGQHVATFARAT